LCRATHITWVSALGCLIIQCRPNVETPVPYIWVQKLSSKKLSGWVTALWACVQPISQLLATGVVSHREELIQCIALHQHCWVPLSIHCTAIPQNYPVHLLLIPTSADSKTGFLHRGKLQSSNYKVLQWLCRHLESVESVFYLDHCNVQMAKCPNRKMAKSQNRKIAKS
jgi:hypothetical protein